MGENEHQKHPLVAPPTQSVDSKPRIRLKSNSTSTCEFTFIIVFIWFNLRLTFFGRDWLTSSSKCCLCRDWQYSDISLSR